MNIRLKISLSIAIDTLYFLLPMTDFQSKMVPFLHSIGDFEEIF